MLMPLVIGRGFARADRREHESGRRAFQVDDGERDDGEHHRDDRVHLEPVGDPDAEGSVDLDAGAEVLVLVAGPHELLDEQREADGEQREVEVADAQARERHEQPERDREHRARRGSRSQTGQPASAASRAAANAPMPARVIWHSEIRPPSPVTSVYER